jgi:hypothetical protein
LNLIMQNRKERLILSKKFSTNIFKNTIRQFFVDESHQFFKITLP